MCACPPSPPPHITNEKPPSLNQTPSLSLHVHMQTQHGSTLHQQVLISSMVGTFIHDMCLPAKHPQTGARWDGVHHGALDNCPNWPPRRCCCCSLFYCMHISSNDGATGCCCCRGRNRIDASSVLWYPACTCLRTHPPTQNKMPPPPDGPSSLLSSSLGS